jgi:hypothetical protein
MSGSDGTIISGNVLTTSSQRRNTSSIYTKLVLDAKHRPYTTFAIIDL